MMARTHSGSGDGWTLTDSDTTLVTTPATVTLTLPRGLSLVRCHPDWAVIGPLSDVTQCYTSHWPETSPETRGQTQRLLHQLPRTL